MHDGMVGGDAPGGIHAHRLGTRLPFRMAGFPWLTVCALGILASIFGLLLSESHTRLQFLSMVALTATITAGSAIARRMREA